MKNAALTHKYVESDFSLTQHRTIRKVKSISQGHVRSRLLLSRIHRQTRARADSSIIWQYEQWRFIPSGKTFALHPCWQPHSFAPNNVPIILKSLISHRIAHTHILASNAEKCEKKNWKEWRLEWKNWVTVEDVYLLRMSLQANNITHDRTANTYTQALL